MTSGNRWKPYHNANLPRVNHSVLLTSKFSFFSPIETKGVDKENIPYAVVLTGTVNVVTTVVAVVVIERVGRRKLILIPCLIIAAIYLLLTVCLTVKVHDALPYTFCLLPRFSLHKKNKTDALCSPELGLCLTGALSAYITLYFDCVTAQEKQEDRLKPLRSKYQIDVPMSNTTDDLKKFLNCSRPG